MHHFFVNPSQIDTTDKSVMITGSDVNHIRNVLLMKPGDELSVSNGVDQKEYHCGILSLESDKVLCEIRLVKKDEVELPSKVYLFQALPKADKMELIIQKAVELGVYQIIPVAAKRCVVKLDERKAGTKIARWQTIAEAAAKQCRRRIVPQVTEVLSFSQAVEKAADIDVRLMPYEMAEGMEKTRKIIDGLRPEQSIAVFIGPEGGFEKEEVQKALSGGIEPVTLGRRILRTETAGMTVLSWIMYRIEQ